jgi:glycosyltransferase involved in cell wall biosynthesis
MKSSKKCTIFLACGSLSYKKGFDILIDALKFVNNSDYKLLILGSGPEEKNLKKQVKDLNLSRKVKFIEFLINPYPFMKASDAIIIPSRHEGCSNVMLEGLFLKKPIISVPCEGANVEILRNKNNCFISNDCSHLSLSETINNFLLNKNKNNKTFLEKKFETSNVVKQYQNLILNT